MSTTSGPVLPESTGNSRDFPSGSFSVAVLSAMVFPLGGAQARHDVLQVGLIFLAAPGDDVPQIVVGQIEQFGEARIDVRAFQIVIEHDVELQQAAPALPLELLSLDAVHHTARLTSNSLMWLIAFVGFRFFGQTSTQFMMVWQRNKRYGSFRLSSRSAVAWSRVSAMKRYACKRPAGPTTLSGFHQNDGHEVEQQAHRMHS